jgi:flavin-dependent dehydrogenase
VEIYPGFAADEVLYEDGAVAGVATKDAGVGKDGVRKDTFARGMELRARQTLFAEGCRGSCSEDVIAKFGLREGKDMQTYGIGMKEVGIENLLPPSIVFCTLVAFDVRPQFAWSYCSCLAELRVANW